MHNLKKGLHMHRTRLAALMCLLVWCLPMASAGYARPPMSFPLSAGHARPRVAAAAAPSCLNDPTISSKVWTVAISDTLAFLGDGQALTILDVSDPARPTCRSHLALPPSIAIIGIQVRGAYAYLALNNDNATDVALQIVDVHDPDNPSLSGSYKAPHAGDLAIAGNLVYLTTVEELKIIDVSNPAAPILASAFSSSFASLQLEGNRLYMNSPSEIGFEILDLTDPLHPARLGGSCPCGSGALWLSFSVSGNRAYLLRSFGGVDVLDISSPNNPLLIGTYANIDFLDGYFHPFTHGFQVIGNRLYIADTRFQIYDLSSPTKATLIGSYDAPGAGYDMWLAGDLAYVGNPERGAQAGDYGFEIIDLSRETNPFLRGWFRNGNTGRFFYMSSIQS
jgi:hypothetical protein